MQNRVRVKRFERENKLSCKRRIAKVWKNWKCSARCETCEIEFIIKLGKNHKNDWGKLWQNHQDDKGTQASIFTWNKLIFQDSTIKDWIYGKQLVVEAINLSEGIETSEFNRRYENHVTGWVYCEW
jgi:hypothetical protein